MKNYEKELLVELEKKHEVEIKFRDEQLEFTRKLLKGIVEEEGKLDHLSRKWEINTSRILTKLIQEAGRLCDYYASDLFTLWSSIQMKLEKGEQLDERYVFAIYDNGVNCSASEKGNYRAVWYLDVKIEDDRMKMILHK